MMVPRTWPPQEYVSSLWDCDQVLAGITVRVSWGLHHPIQWTLYEFLFIPVAQIPWTHPGCLQSTFLNIVWKQTQKESLQTRIFLKYILEMLYCYFLVNFVSSAMLSLGDGPRRWASEMGLGDGPRRWASEMGLGDGPRRWASEMGLGDGPRRWASEMSPYIAPVEAEWTTSFILKTSAFVQAKLELDLCLRLNNQPSVTLY